MARDWEDETCPHFAKRSASQSWVADVPSTLHGGYLERRFLAASTPTESRFPEDGAL